MATAVSETNPSAPAAETRRAYEYCRRVTAAHAKSFYFAAKFLPARKRPPIYAVYALCRHVDDAVDESGIRNEAQAIAAVEDWRAKLEKVYRQSPKSKVQSPESGGQNLVLLAWRDLLKTYKIPPHLPLELLRGVLMDTYVKRYESFDRLYVYCYRVASVVGLMTSEIFGYENPETLRRAEALGIGMQLTNILRDVGEDARMGRIYLPQEDLRRFGVSDEQILARETDANFINLMKFEIERARLYYREAEKGILLLEKDSRLAVLLAHRLYSRILDEIERQNYDVFARRARTSKRQKVFSIPRIWLEARNL